MSGCEIVTYEGRDRTGHLDRAERDRKAAK
jgi:hypothetical protein